MFYTRITKFQIHKIKDLKDENVKNQNNSTDFVKYKTLLSEKTGNNHPELNKNKTLSKSLIVSKIIPRKNIRKKLTNKINKDKLFDIDKTKENLIPKNNIKKVNYINLKIHNIDTKKLFRNKYKNKFNDILPIKNNNNLTKIQISHPKSTRVILTKNSKQNNITFRQEKPTIIESYEKQTYKKVPNIRSKSNSRKNKKISSYYNITFQKYNLARDKLLNKNNINNTTFLQDSIEISKNDNNSGIACLSKNYIKKQNNLKNVKITRVIKENKKISKNNKNRSKDNDVNKILKYKPKTKSKNTINNQKNKKLKINSNNKNVNDTSINEKNGSKIYKNINIFQNQNGNNDVSVCCSIPILDKSKKNTFDENVNSNSVSSIKKRYIVNCFEYDYDKKTNEKRFNHKLMEGLKININQNIFKKNEELNSLSFHDKGNEKIEIDNKRYDFLDLKESIRNKTYDDFQNTKNLENSFNEYMKKKQPLIQIRNLSFKEKFKSLSKKRYKIKLRKQSKCGEDPQFEVLRNKISKIILEVKKMNK